MDWTTILTPAIPALCGLGLGVLRLIAYWLRLRAELQARPDQLAAIEKLEQPNFLINRNGPALVMVSVGGALALATLFSGYTGVAGAPPGCSPATCKPPARCTADGCADVARPHGALAGDPPWATPRGVWDGRARFLGGGS